MPSPVFRPAPRPFRGRTPLAAVAAVALLFTLLPVASATATPSNAASEAAGVAPATSSDRVVVTLDADADADAVASDLLEELRAEGAADATVAHVADHAGAVVLSGVPAAMLDGLADLATVVEVEPEILVRPQLSRSIPWVGADVAHADGHRGRGAAIAVLDTGVDRHHPALRSAITHEACFVTPTAANGYSTCPNGTSMQVGAGAAAPCEASGCGHGTHVAGTAVGRSHNGRSPGVAPEADLIAVQIFDRDGASASSGDIIAALDWILGLTRDGTAPVAAVNLSLGGSLHAGTCDAGGMRRMVERLAEAGVVTVAAAGNQGADAAIAWPACTSGVVAVGASSGTDTRLPWSNTSPQLDLYAPGSGISAAVPGGGYARMSGTSMATPHVAGAVAALHRLPHHQGVDLVPLLKTLGPSVASPSGARRRLDVAGVTTVPPRPRSASASHGDRRATVRFDPGAGLLGVVVTGYDVTLRPGGRRVQLPATARSATLTGLDNHVRYTAEVRARTLLHVGPVRTSNLVIPKPRPPAHGFRDVPRGAYYDPAVAWARAENITAGVDTHHYGPAEAVTRAQMATFLWRLAGQPTGHPTHGFRDVPRGAHFDAPVAWAKSTGVALGTSSDRFAPAGPVTRAQMAAFLWRLASTPDAWDTGVRLPDAIIF